MKLLSLLSLALVGNLAAAPRLFVDGGTIEPGMPIELILDKEACPADRIGKVAATKWLSIEPAWKGKTVWKEANVLSFEPSEAPALGTRYTFTLTGKHIHLDGSAVPAGELGQAATPRFRVDYATWLHRYEKEWSPRTGAWFLRFNDAVNADQAAGFFSYKDKSGRTVAAKVKAATFGELKHPGYVVPTYLKRWEAAIAGESLEPDLSPEAVVPTGLIISPAEPLPVGADWRLVMKEGFKGAAGKPAGESIRHVGDITALKVQNVLARTVADEPRRVVVDFNQKLPSEIAPEMITLVPEVPERKIEVHGDELHVLGDFSEYAQWTVKVAPEVVSWDGRQLGQAHEKKIEFKRLAPEVGLPSEDETQLASGSRIYRVSTVNVESLKLRIKQLDGEQLIRAQQGYRYYTGDGPDGEQIRPTRMIPYEMMVGKTVVDLDIPLEGGLDTSKQLVIDWDAVIAGDPKPYQIGKAGEPAAKPGPPAAFFVEIVGVPRDGCGAKKKPAVQSLVQLTDIGMAWKITGNEARVLAFSCKTGQPVQGVAIEVFGEDAVKLGAVETDASGMAVLARDEAARHLRAVRGADQFSAPFDTSLPTVGLWRFPVRYSWNEPPMEKRRVFLFTDRSLYRPGETVHLKGLVRQQDGNEIRMSEGDGVKLRVSNPTGRDIIERDITVSEKGSFDETFTLPSETTGYHQIWVEWTAEAEAAAKLTNWVDRSHALESSRFALPLRVEEFRRNAFEITHETTAPKPGDDEVILDLEATYFHGQPVANGETDVWTRVQDENFYPERFRDYLFGDHRQPDFGYWFHYFGYRWQDDYGSRNSTSESEEVQLDGDGRVQVKAGIPESEFPMLRRVTIETTVTDANRQTLSKSTGVIVHPSAVHAGIARLDRLVRVGDEVPLKVLAVTPEGERVTEAVTMSATLTREVNEQVRMQHANGRGAVRNESRDEELKKETLELAAGGSTELMFAPTKPGLHTIELRGADAEGRPFATATTIHVYGADEYPWAYEDHMRIKLVAEKKRYQPGDTARVLVLSPIEGKALVTVEREDVSRSFLTDLKATEPVIEIPIGDEDAPNCYVSVLVIKGAEESLRKHKEPQLRLGYCELMVENVRDRLAVTLDPPTGAEKDGFLPGSEIGLTGRVTLADGRPAAGAELTIYAEDEGTLSVVGYDTPEPMNFFYDPRLLRVECGTSLGNFIPEAPDEQTFFNKGFFIGGGDGGAANALEIPRRDFDPCAFWMPSVVAGADGRFELKSKLPDTLTRYRLMVVVHHDATRFGHAEDEFVVNKPVMLEPQVPRFAHEGDTQQMKALLQNASDQSGTWEVTILPDTSSSEPVAVLSDGVKPTVTVELEAGKSASVMFPVEYRTTGRALIRWKAEPVHLAGRDQHPDFRRLSDSVESSFDVEYPVPLLRQNRMVRFEGADGMRDLLDDLDPRLLGGRGEIELEASRSLLLEAGGAVDYLMQYPYGCLEQTTSSLMPWLAVEQLREVSPALARYSSEEVDKVVQQGVDRLIAMQRQDGGFGYWHGATKSNRWASSYAGLGLILASESATVSPSVIDAVATYLQKQLRELPKEPTSADLEITARDLWVLALAGEPQQAYVNKLWQDPARLSSRARCFLALAEIAGGRVDVADAIMRDPTPCTVADNSWMRWRPDEGLQLLVWTAIDAEGKEAADAIVDLLQSRNPYGHWRTTWVNAWSLMALGAYAEARGEITPTTVAWSEIEPGGVEDKGEVILDQENPLHSQYVPLHDGLKLSAGADGEAYLRVRLSAKPELAPIQPVATNGLEITRFYQRVLPDGSTEPLGIPRVGDLIRVDLRVNLPKDDERYLVVEDRLPSVFEAINNSFESQAAPKAAGRTSESAWSISHSEVRDDRVMFFFDRIYSRGTRTLTYLARCTMAGKAYAPSAKVEAMYDPDHTALSASRQFEVPVTP
mgnify:CR=1 FL=1